MKLLLFSLFPIISYSTYVGGDWLAPRKPGDISEVELDNIPVAEYNDDKNSRPLLFPSNNPGTQNIGHNINLPGIDQYENERAHGSIADLFASNRHYKYPNIYEDLGRRQDVKPFKTVHNRGSVGNSLVPKKASPEFVLAVAKKSLKEQAALAEQGIYPHQDDVPKHALRSGDYWNAVYVENVDSKNLLRTANTGLENQNKRRKPKELHTIKAKVLPNSEIYDLISILTKVSPRLVYVVSNKNSD